MPDPQVNVPFMPWPEFMANYFVWQQGQHVVVCAPTGQGKTYLISKILEKRKHVVLFASKGHDDTLTSQFPQYNVITKWPPPTFHKRVILWPTRAQRKGTIRDMIRTQRSVFTHALNNIFTERGWCVAIDEEHWFCKNLGLAMEIETFLNQARSAGISLVNGVQRPAHVPLATYSGSSHAFIGKYTEAADLKRITDLGGIDRKTLLDAVRQLDRLNHEFLYVDATGERPPVRTRVS